MRDRKIAETCQHKWCFKDPKDQQLMWTLSLHLSRYHIIAVPVIRDDTNLCALIVHWKVAEGTDVCGQNPQCSEN